MKIEILLFDGFDDLDAFGPFEVLTEAGLDTRFVTIEPAERVTSAHGARIVPDGVLGDPDLVLVPGGGWHDRSGPGAYAEARRGVITKALAERHARGRRIGSSARARCCSPRPACSPAAPRSPTTARSRTCAASAPTSIDGARVVDDGDIITAAGVTSGIDLALHLIERELGRSRGGRGGRDRMGPRARVIQHVGGGHARLACSSAPSRPRPELKRVDP